MKKTLFIISIVLTILFLFFCSLYVIDHIKMENDEPVVFSTWGKKYLYPEGITQEEAIKNAREMLDDKSIKTIINLNNPKIEEVVFDKNTLIYTFRNKIDLSGKHLYKIKFNTTQDGLLGPIVFYVDKFKGEIIGAEFRE